MIRFEFQGSVIEGERYDQQEGVALIEFRVQHPIREGVVFQPPTLNGKVFEEVARVRNVVRGVESSYTLEYEIHESGSLVIESYMSMKSLTPNVFRIGVQRMDSGILVVEETPQAFPWFIDGEFIDPSADGCRSLLIPYSAPEPTAAAPRLDMDYDALLDGPADE